MTMQNEATLDKQKKAEEKPGYKLTKLGWIPEDWEILKLSDVAVIQTGIQKGINKTKTSIT